MSNLHNELETSNDNEVTPELVKQETSLKGTLVSVFLLGIFIIISWLSIFILFIARN